MVEEKTAEHDTRAMPHYVSNKDESVRMFKSDWIDAFSRVDFRVPLILYVPLVIVLLVQSFEKVRLFAILPLLALGLALWTLTEYQLHRFVFHWVPRGKFGHKMHFILHGVHHDYPRDSKRLVMVPTVTVPLAFFFYFGFDWAFAELTGDSDLALPCFAGFVLGYLFYDLTHYALHHATLQGQFWQELKQHHMAHHYQDSRRGFGVSTQFWDQIFRTTFRRSAPEPEIKSQHS